jgi:signal transduction histidine kinase
VIEPPPRSIQTNQLIRSELRWFVALRWLAGVAMLVGGLAYSLLASQPTTALTVTLVGVGVLAYNAVLFPLLRTCAESPRRPRLLRLAWAQIGLDLTALTVVCLATGSLRSPFLGFYVLHMIFASLLLGSTAAYVAALTAIAMLWLGLIATRGWPIPRADAVPAAGWIAALWLTVFITNHITSGLHRREGELSAVNRALRRQQEALLQQEKMNTMGQMAAGITHEIANPLANIDSLLQLVERDAANLNGQTTASLREQVRRIQTIIHHMRYFAHPAGGCWEMTDLADLLMQSLEMVRFDQRLRDVRVERDLPAGLGEVRLMPHAVQQVVINLIMNALDALEGTPEPRLRLSARIEDGAVKIRVSDNGPGIPVGDEEQIFEPFHTTKEAGKGTGLGLAISRSLVRRHHGDLRLVRGPQPGAAFCITLPLTPESRVRERQIGGFLEGENNDSQA